MAAVPPFQEAGDSGQAVPIGDAWFDVVPTPMAAFSAAGEWIRHNRAFAALIASAPWRGARLDDQTLALQILVGWTQSEALQSLTPNGTPLCTLGAKICACASGNHDTHHYLCVVDNPETAKQLIVAVPSAPMLVRAPQQEITEKQADSPSLLKELSAILDNSPAGIAHFVDGKVIRCNRRFERMLGFPVGEGTVHHHLEHFLHKHPPVRSVIKRSQLVLQQQNQFESEIQVFSADGLPAWYAFSATRISAIDEPLDAMVVLSNITRLRNQQSQLESLGRELSQQADRTRAILDSVLVGIVTLDERGISWMNRSARRMFGGELEDFIGQTLAVVAPPELDHPFRLTDYLDDMEDGQAHSFECQMSGKDGRDFWVVGNAVVTFDDHRNRRITYALLDIDKRREAEARVEQAESKLKRIIELAPMAMSVHEAPSLRMVEANQGALAFMRRDSHMPWGPTLEDILPPDQARLMRAEMISALDSQMPLRREHQIEIAPGIQQFWDINYLPITGDGESSELVLLVATDVTEQRAAEKARIEAAIAQRDLLVKEVHHRIKNNLQGVAGLLQQIASSKPDLASAISEVVGQVQAIAHVYGLQVGNSTVLALDKVVKAITQSVQRLFTHPIEVALLTDDLSEWQLPENESIPIALCLNELLTNAHKHGSIDKPISCTLDQDESGIRITIKNEGQLPLGFDFAKVKGSVSGLGLVRALAPRRSSYITIRQEGPLVMTEFVLRSPSIHRANASSVMAEPNVQQYSLWTPSKT
jgi:PAS domain S-box-containing protein